jgi:predicted cupin superfamily sugar epimerase
VCRQALRKFKLAISAESTGVYSLVDCSVAPGFEFEDFSFLRDESERKEKFLKEFSNYRKFV